MNEHPYPICFYKMIRCKYKSVVKIKKSKITITAMTPNYKASLCTFARILDQVAIAFFI